MKKFYALFLALACIVAVGCDKGTPETPKTTTPPAGDSAPKTTDPAPTTGAETPK